LATDYPFGHRDWDNRQFDEQWAVIYPNPVSGGGLQARVVRGWLGEDRDMTDIIEDYRAVKEVVPGRYKRWHLRGAGLESLSEESVDLAEIGRKRFWYGMMRAAICSPISKIINLGDQHPRPNGPRHD